jgi:hypothetical protein
MNRNNQYLLKENLINREFIFQIRRRRNAGKRFEIPYKVGLIEVTAVISNRSQRHFIFGNEPETKLKAVYFVKRFRRKPRKLIHQFMKIPGRNAVL